MCSAIHNSLFASDPGQLLYLTRPIDSDELMHNEIRSLSSSITIDAVSSPQ